MESCIEPQRKIGIAVRSILASRDHITNPPIRSRSADEVTAAGRATFRIGERLVFGLDALVDALKAITGHEYKRRGVCTRIRAGRSFRGVVVERVGHCQSLAHRVMSTRMAA